MKHFELQPAEEGNKNNECRIMALVVAPSRELINQIYALFKPICKTLKFNLIRLFGSGGSNKKRIRIGIEHFKGDWSV
jgi:superfamily II DNA/RNA helicase